MLYVRIFLLLWAVFIFQPSESQSIIRSAIGSAGTTSFGGGIVLRHTTGQSSGTEVFSDNQGMLRQGFQQPVDLSMYTNVPLPPGSVFRIFPNPASEYFYVDLISDSPFDLYLTDMYGKRIFHGLNLTGPRIDFDLQTLVPGVYLVTIVANGKSDTRKLIVISR